MTVTLSSHASNSTHSNLQFLKTVGIKLKVTAFLFNEKKKKGKQKNHTENGRILFPCLPDEIKNKYRKENVAKYSALTTVKGY